MDIASLKHIARLGSDIDGLTPSDRVSIRKASRGHVKQADLEKAFAMFSDLVITKKEFRSLLTLLDPLSVLSSVRTLRNYKLKLKLRDVVGRYGRKVRTHHMLAVLKRVGTVKDVRSQRALMRKLRLMKPRHEVELLKPLERLYENPRSDGRVARLALAIHHHINRFARDDYLLKNKSLRLSYDAEKSPALRRSKSHMKKCISVTASCAQYLDPALLRDKRFVSKVLNAKTGRYMFGNLPRIPEVDALNFIGQALYSYPSLFKYAVPYLKRVDPTLAFVIAACAVAGDADNFKQAFPMLRAIDKGPAIARGLVSARSSRDVFAVMLPWIKKLPRKESSRIAFALLQRDFSAIGLVHTFLVGTRQKNVHEHVAWILENDFSTFPYARAILPKQKLESSVFETVLGWRIGITPFLKTDKAIPHLVPYLRKWQRGSDMKKRKYARAVIRHYMARYPEKLYFMKRKDAVTHLISTIGRFYQKRRQMRLPQSYEGNDMFPLRVVATIPGTFLSDPKLQRVLFKASFHEISWLQKKHPDIPLDRKVKRDYDKLVGQARALGITTLTRFYSTAQLREIIRNRKNIDRVDGRPLAVVIFPHADLNRAFRYNDIHKLMKSHRVVYFEVNSPKLWIRAFERATRAQKSSTLYLAGHGLRTKFRLGRRDKKSFRRVKGGTKNQRANVKELRVNKNKFFTAAHVKKLSRYRDRMAPNGHILMMSCYTGNGGGQGYDIATAFSDVFPTAFVHAPVGAMVTDYTKTILGKYGRLRRIIPEIVDRMTLHRASRTARVHFKSKFPVLLYSAAGWDDRRRKVTPSEYRSHMRSRGYMHGMRLYPTRLTLSTRERFLLDVKTQLHPSK